MSDFLKIVAGMMICLIAYLVLMKHNKDFSLLLSVAACCMILSIFVSYLQPVLNFFRKIEDLGGLNTQITEVLLQAVGIGVLSEISAMVCTDAGNSSLAKVINLVATSIVLFISLPLFECMLDLVTGILGEI